ncbi:MAG: FAD-dependent oxidoreductase, partial [Bacteroidetes bacterium]
MRVLVIGGGIGGLATAVALRQNGMDVTVYEQSKPIPAAGAGLLLWSNALTGLQTLGLAEKVIQAGMPIESTQIRHWRGRLLSDVDVLTLSRRAGMPSVAIHRADLYRILVEALPPDCIQFGMRAESVTQLPDGVEVGFANGRFAKGELLIGADGIHSSVRQCLWPELSLRYSGYTAYRGVAPQPGALPAGVISESWGPGKRFGIVPLSNGWTYWYATENTRPGRKMSPDQLKAHLQKQFSRWHHPVPLLLQATSAHALLHHDVYDLAPVTNWVKGRVLLLGDAIHPTTPNFGQGAGMAVESAVVLGKCLAVHNHLDAAFSCYEQHRQPRTAWITAQSQRIGRVAQWRSGLSRAMRDYSLQILS